MSRSKRDILDTEAMLIRLMAILSEHQNNPAQTYAEIRADAEALRRISMTLHRWHEAECNGDVETDETTGRAYSVGGRNREHRYGIPNRETGARKRLAAIMKRYPGLTAYVQTDPRGCALYILTKADVPEGANVDSCYSRGLAVHQ